VRPEPQGLTTEYGPRFGNHPWLNKMSAYFLHPPFPNQEGRPRTRFHLRLVVNAFTCYIPCISLILRQFFTSFQNSCPDLVVPTSTIKPRSLNDHYGSARRMSNEIDGYILCDDSSSLSHAIAAIQPASVLVLDCEGKTLGVEGGTLSLIILRALEPEISKAYLIDTISLTKDQLNPIFDIIQSSSVTKIMYDGRKDFSELYHGCNVYLRGVLDLQLADVNSRRQRGENQWKQISRLLAFLPGREVYRKQYFYSAVHKLSGLEGSVGEHKIIKIQKNDPSKDGFDSVMREVYPDILSVTHSDWLIRPLSEQYLRYSSRDAYLISMLYAHFKERGYTNNHRLSTQSARYVSIFQGARPVVTDIFHRHCLLPLHILDYNGSAETRPCISCRRSLPQTAYPPQGWKTPSKRQCWVCRAVSVKSNMTTTR